MVEYMYIFLFTEPGQLQRKFAQGPASQGNSISLALFF